MNRKRGLPFIALGVAFMAIGITGRTTFFILGLVFIILGIALMRRAHP